MRNNQEDVLKDVNKSIQTYDKCHTFTNLFIYLKKYSLYFLLLKSSYMNLECLETWLFIFKQMLGDYFNLLFVIPLKLLCTITYQELLKPQYNNNMNTTNKYVSRIIYS